MGPRVFVNTVDNFASRNISRVRKPCTMYCFQDCVGIDILFATFPRPLASDTFHHSSNGNLGIYIIGKTAVGAAATSEEEEAPQASEKYFIVGSVSHPSRNAPLWVDEVIKVRRLVVCCFLGPFAVHSGRKIANVTDLRLMVTDLNSLLLLTSSKPKVKEDLETVLLSCDVIIYDITSSADQVDEASWAVSCE